MMIARLLIFLLLVGCARKAVESLDDWQGKTEAWVVSKLGAASSDIRLRQPIPNVGPVEGIQARLQKQYPPYKDEVRQLSWKKNGRVIQVVAINRDGYWIVLDAMQWKEGVAF